MRKKKNSSEPAISQPDTAIRIDTSPRFNILCDTLERKYNTGTLGFTITKKHSKVTACLLDSDIVDKQIVLINGWDCTGSYDTVEFCTKMKERPLMLHFQSFDHVRSRFIECYSTFKKNITKSINMFLILDKCSAEIKKIETYKKDEGGVPKCGIHEMNEIYQSIKQIYQKINC